VVARLFDHERLITGAGPAAASPHQARRATSSPQAK
jgi:hypothetical protein